MSRQAFDKLFSVLSVEEKNHILAIAATYGIDMDAPEWIPFALSQHGLISIQKSTKNLEDALKRGSALAVAEAIKAIAAVKTDEQAALKQASEDGRKAVMEQANQSRQDIAAAAKRAQDLLVRNITEQIGQTTRDIVEGEIRELQKAGSALTTAVEEATRQIEAIKDVKTTHVAMWSIAAGMASALLMTSFMFVSMRLGWVEVTADNARITQMTLNGNQISRIIVDEMRHRGR